MMAIQAPYSGGGTSMSALVGFLDGLSQNRQALSVVESGGSVYLDVTALDGGDMIYFLDGVRYALDCQAGAGAGGAARVELTQGTATEVMLNYAWVEYDTQAGIATLISGVTPPSTGAFAIVALVGLRDAATVAASGPDMLQRTTEAVEHNEKGSISWMREKMRIRAEWWSGVDPQVQITVNGASEDNVNIVSTNGTIFQLHRQTFPDYDVSSDGIWVANASGAGVLSAMQRITDLNACKETSDGSALVDGDIIVLTIWGAINYSTSHCRLFVNLPSDVYTVAADALNDSNNTADNTVPFAFRTVGFLIARVVLKYNTAASGTWTNVMTDGVKVWNNQAANVSSPSYPADYPNNQDVTTTLTKAGASKVRVHFDAFNTESNYDYVRLYDAANVLKWTYHGNLGDFTSGEIDGDTVKVRFTSDGSVQRSGFHIDSLEYETTVASGADFYDLRGLHSGINIGG